MPDSEHALLKQAFQHAEHCIAEANAIVDYLDQAIEDLQEEEPELREAVTQSLEKADQFIDHCGQIVQDLLELRLKYRASHSTTGLPSEVDLLTETLARIKARRRSGRHIQE
jgi:septation ring formation regulator EzrA